MSNTLDAVVPQLLAQGLNELRENTVMPQVCSRAYESLAGQKGSTIDVPIASAISAGDVTPAATVPAGTALAPTSVPVALDQWKEAAFVMTDKEQEEVMNGTIPMGASSAIKALANLVDAYILALYVNFYGYTGTAGTTPFATAESMASAIGARTVLNRQLAPLNDRNLILDVSAEGNALNQRAMQDASWRNDDTVLKTGMIGRALGMGWYMDQNVPTHTAGTITTGLISKAATAYAVGVKTLAATTAASTGACALKVGDIITFAGDTQTYVLTAAATQASAATDVTLAFEPGLKVAHTGSEAVTVKASHVVNLCLQREAIAFATRPLQSNNAARLGSVISQAIDPISGLTLRLEVNRQHRQERWAWDILFGAKVIRRELGCRLAG